MERKSVEDYMAAMYTLYEAQDDTSAGIRSVDIAERLGVTRATVSIMLRKLKKSGLVRTTPYSRLHFTGRGMEEAKRIIFKHRVVEVFLQKVLGYGPEDAHSEAHRLEHVFSDESIRRLNSFLDNPERCPHGNIITGVHLSLKLSEAREGTAVEISCIECGPDLKKRLSSMGLYDGTTCRVLKNDGRSPLILKVLGSKVVLGREQARATTVRAKGEKRR